MDSTDAKNMLPDSKDGVDVTYIKEERNIESCGTIEEFVSCGVENLESDDNILPEEFPAVDRLQWDEIKHEDGQGNANDIKLENSPEITETPSTEGINIEPESTSEKEVTKPIKLNLLNMSNTVKSTSKEIEICAVKQNSHDEPYIVAKHSTKSDENQESHPTFNCKVCNKQFSKRRQLYKHRRVHQEIRPYSCTYCLKTFKHRGNMNEHIKYLHKGIRPYKCENCEREFATRRNYEQHIRIHVGIRPFKCDQCGKAYTGKGILNKHLRTHEGFCPFRCNVCNKAFTRRGSLNKHLRTHEGIKPFQCSQCKKGFSEKGNLNAHLRIHEGSRPFKCTLCDKSFTTKGSLKRHTSIHQADASQLRIYEDEPNK